MTAIRMQRIAGSDAGRMQRSRLERRTLAGALMRRSRGWDRALKRWRSADARTRSADRHGRAYDKIWGNDVEAMLLRGLHAIGNARAVGRAIGVSSATYYRRRQQDPMFKVRWERKLNMRFQELEEILLDRAVNGFEEDIWYRGKHLGKRVVYDHELAMRLLELALERESVARQYRRSGWMSEDMAADFAWQEVDRSVRSRLAWARIAAQDAADKAADDAAQDAAHDVGGDASTSEV